MVSVSRKSIKRAGIIAGAAALFMSLIPGQAFAISQVPCNSSDYLQIWFHDGSGSATACYANAGLTYIWGNNTVWIDKVSTGNNNVVIHDDNGTDVYISRNNIVTYPNRPVATTHLNIL
ncbi:beta/gamma crystallin domain-containing protein [Actinoallomurus sp. NPDC052308]|uniref:beta/gamma crystallin domain-containing protein n=1 Tax=Actinoallomurus sp. NPDC052308 TaxID=3155530 RepID=UPI0034498AB8